jgi:nucleotide-binding universal stress UspA family protein
MELHRLPCSPRRYVVGVDGSELSLRAFQTATALMHGEDTLEVLHVADPMKEGLPYDSTPEAIEAFYTAKLVSALPRARWRYITKVRTLGESTKAALCRYVNDDSHHFDVLVVGVTGRKGPKDDPSVLGSTADYSLREAHMTSVLVRNRTFPADAIFAVGTDGSESAHRAVTAACTMAQRGQTVIVFHIEDPKEEKEADAKYTAAAIRARYESGLTSDATVRFAVHRKAPLETISSAIISFAREHDATYIVIGADGVGAHVSGTSTWGSVSDNVVKHAKCTVVVTQPHGGLYKFHHEGDTLTDD